MSESFATMSETFAVRRGLNVLGVSNGEVPVKFQERHDQLLSVFRCSERLELAMPSEDACPERVGSVQELICRREIIFNFFT